MSQAASSASADNAGLLGSVTFGPRDGGNGWVVVLIVVGGLLVGLLIWKGKSK